MEDALKFLEIFYLSVTNDKKLLKSHLQKKEFIPLSVHMQEKILEKTIKSPHTTKYSPPISYQKFFLRTILDTIENNGLEVSEYLIEAYANILSQISHTADIIYRTYEIKDCIITLEESSCFVTNSTTGLQTWEASKYLLEWCLENASILENKRILELGSGIGLLGIVITKVCRPQKYLFTDKSSDVLDTLSKNIKINLEESIARDVVEKHQILWGEFTADEVNHLAADLILGADIVFDPCVIQKLVQTIKLFLDQGRTKCAYIANTIRNMDTNEHFTTHLASTGLKYEILDCHKSCLFIYNGLSKFLLYRIYKDD